jgi:pyruvate,orthophosphate dikinase
VNRWTVRIDGSIVPDPQNIGGKAASIARMTALGLRVPPAFVVTTEACRAFLSNGEMPADGWTEIDAGIAWLEAETRRSFGGSSRPLLVAVRSGAAVSMPGMMDTVLDLGINGETEAALAREMGDPAFAAQTRTRFEELFVRIVLRGSGEGVPHDPRDQLRRAVIAVFESSRSRRARAYRRHHGLADDLPTAVTVQAMVFGNLDDRSGTGVLFTRNPLTGAPVPYGEFLSRAQGEDVVSGARTPASLESLSALMPHAHEELLVAGRLLENVERDVQDVEFTIERDTLFLLQTRTAKRSADAAVRIAVDLAREGKIGKDEAVGRLTAAQVRAVLRPRLSQGARAATRVLARGEPASPGVGTGAVVEDCDEAERRAADGERVVLVRPTTSPEDVHGIIAAQAVITEVGGSTSHAAVVSRSLNKPCVVGCGPGTAAVLAGRNVTVDGDGGEVLEGVLDLEEPREQDHPYLAELGALAGNRRLLDILEARDSKS